MDYINIYFCPKTNKNIMRAIERDEIQDVIESVNKVMEKQLSPAFYEIVDR